MKRNNKEEPFDPNKQINMINIYIDNIKTPVKIKYILQPQLEFTILITFKGKPYEQKIMPKEQNQLFSKEDIGFGELRIHDRDKDYIASSLDSIMNKIFD